jgi:histone H3/H4
MPKSYSSWFGGDDKEDVPKPPAPKTKIKIKKEPGLEESLKEAKVKKPAPKAKAKSRRKSKKIRVKQEPGTASVLSAFVTPNAEDPFDSNAAEEILPKSIAKHMCKRGGMTRVSLVSLGPYVVRRAGHHLLNLLEPALYHAQYAGRKTVKEEDTDTRNNQIF